MFGSRGVVLAVLGLLLAIALLITWLAKRGNVAGCTSRSVRMVCPVCGAWTEQDSLKLMAPLWDGGLPDDWPPDKVPTPEEGAAITRFLEKHITCLDNHDGMIRCVYEDDVEFHRLDPNKEE